jgi:50S ribosomal protein L16 3-hydroxylase
MYQLKTFDTEQFLAQYWQKKPFVIKQGFSDFIDPLDEHDLAGLSEEENVDSRIVSYKDEQWQVTHGPYTDINQHCVGAWSLLVQAVDQYIPEADQLMAAFDFIPNWRRDDLMVSYSNQSAGVGPHKDQYDVFIIQGKGSRRWQVGLPGEHTQLRPHGDLSQIAEFPTVIDQILVPGDIIYIPAGHPHNGVALEDCLNYSVGFRAPSQQEMLSSFADHAIDHNLFNRRYTDPNLQLRQFSGEINQQELGQFKAFLRDSLDSQDFDHWLASFMSRNKDESQQHLEDLDQYSAEHVTALLNEGQSLSRMPAVKAVYVQSSLSAPSLFSFYINAQEYSISADLAEPVKHFLAAPVLYQLPHLNSQQRALFSQLLSQLINDGHWLFD